MRSQILSRFLKIEERGRQNLPNLDDVLHARHAYLGGWIVVGGLTAVYLLWLWFRLVGHPAWQAWLSANARLAAPALLSAPASELVDLVELGWGLTLALLWIFLLWLHAHRTDRYGFSLMAKDQLSKMSPKAFEHFVARLYRRKGYKVVHRGRSGDHGVDLELTSTTGRKAIAQCKRYQNTIGEEIVRELYGTLIHEKVARAFLITTADISEAARRWAKGKPITLIDGRTLVRIASSLEDTKRG